MLAGLQHPGVGLGTKGEAVGPFDPRREQGLNCLGDVARVAIAVLAELDRVVRRDLDDAGYPGRFPTVEDGGVLGHSNVVGGLVEWLEIGILGAALGIGQLRASD